MKETYYFAYGSNMNLDQMAYRCPAASVVENVKLEGYRLTFCGRGKGSGVATILPEEGSQVEGVLWKITPECEKSLDFYEGYPPPVWEGACFCSGKGWCETGSHGIYHECTLQGSACHPLGSLFYGDRGRLPSEWDFQPICDRCAKAYQTGSGKAKSQSQENRSQ